MRDADKYRAFARHCLDSAKRAIKSDDRNLWLEMAQTWLGMIPERQRKPEDRFDTAVRDRGTGQQPSTSEH